MGQADTCEGELDGVEGKFAFINGSSNLANCSIAERAERMQEAKAAGLVTDRVIKGRYNATEYNIKIPVFTLVGKDSKDVRERILEFNKSTGSYFYMYSTADEGRSFDMRYDINYNFLSKMGIITALFSCPPAAERWTCLACPSLQ